MPLYEYECNEHGVFEEQNPMASSAEPVDCPQCRASSPRVLSVPQLRLLSNAARRARSINEKSQHEPRVVSRDLAAPKTPPAPRIHSAPGRPWAIGH